MFGIDFSPVVLSLAIMHCLLKVASGIVGAGGEIPDELLAHLIHRPDL